MPRWDGERDRERERKREREKEREKIDLGLHEKSQPNSQALNTFHPGVVCYMIMMPRGTREHFVYKSLHLGCLVYIVHDLPTETCYAIAVLYSPWKWRVPEELMGLCQYVMKQGSNRGRLRRLVQELPVRLHDDDGRIVRPDKSLNLTTS